MSAPAAAVGISASRLIVKAAAMESELSRLKAELRMAGSDLEAARAQVRTGPMIKTIWKKPTCLAEASG